MKETLLQLAAKRKIENEEIQKLKSSLSSFDSRLELFSIHNLFSTQSFSKYPEDLITKQLKGTKNLRKDRTGDFNCKEYGNVEYKYSIAKEHYGKFLQIRPHHNVDFYIFDIYFENKLDTFLLSKNQVLQELKEKSCLTHGTNDRRNNNIDLEYSLEINKERYEKWCRIYKTNI